MNDKNINNNMERNIKSATDVNKLLVMKEKKIWQKKNKLKSNESIKSTEKVDDKPKLLKKKQL